MEPCPFCLSDIPAAATRCAHCAGDLAIPSDSPDLAGYWVVGILLAVVGLVVAAAAGGGAWIGFVIAGVGGVLIQIGTIAFAVSLGGRHQVSRIYRTRRANAEKVVPQA